jgi:excisionase family DNA binding protein
MRKRREHPLPPKDKDILSLPEVAALFGLGETTIRQLVRLKTNPLPARFVGRRILIHRDDAVAYFAPNNRAGYQGVRNASCPNS